jgi:hypothetical protein
MGRKLRIAFSVVCGILCLLMVAFWVRSYYYEDFFETKTTWRVLRIRSSRGRIEFWQHDVRRMFRGNVSITPQDAQLILKELSINKWYASEPVQRTSMTRDSNGRSGFRWHNQDPTTILGAPYWFLVALTGASAVGPWIRWPKRFSLLTLLIGMTLAAIVLGVCVYLLR